MAVTQKQVKEDRDEEYYITPEFIYGGPFIPVKKPSPFVDSITPINITLQGTFRRSFAYFSLKDRLPVILTRLIDYLSREGSKSGGTAEDLSNFMQVVTKLKNDLITNKDYDPFTVDTPEAKKWNIWLRDQLNQKYFNNNWVFTECYVYRKLYEGCELNKSLLNFDYFEDQKNRSFQDSLEAMCLVADKLGDMLNKGDKDKRRADFITLLKICLWANRCDLSLSLGAPVSLSGPVAEVAEGEKPPESEAKAPAPKAPEPDPKAKGKAPEPPKPVSSDPFQMILDLKDKLLVDDTGKIADLVVAKSEAMQKAIEGNTTFKFKCSCHRLATAFGMPLCEEEKPEVGTEVVNEDGEAVAEEAPKIPCPAKMTIPNHVMFDIICDNAGYELFADLCLATFLIEQEIVQMVRFHVKRMPWFVSDVTRKDFQFVINSCTTASYKKDGIPGENEGDEGTPPITSDNLKELGGKFNQMLSEGKFVVMDEEFWTYPHVYRDMKKYDYNMYRKLQYAIALMFKGDLNYRKLLGDRNVNPYVGLEPCLQGFIPAPIIAVRTVKAELICGLPKGKYDVLNKLDERWMQTGEYGVIQLCPKAEPLKVADRPCLDYCEACHGVICPEHTLDM